MRNQKLAEPHVHSDDVKYDEYYNRLVFKLEPQSF